jgi:hypothetical protein
MSRIPMFEAADQGLVVRCSADGLISRIVKQALDLAASVTPGATLADLASEQDREKVGRFLAELRTDQVAYDWEITVPLARGPVPLHFSGCAVSDGFVVLVAPNRSAQERHEAIESRQGAALESAHRELLLRNAELDAIVHEVRSLRGLIPICAQCKDIRDEADAWVRLEDYLRSHTEARFTHGLCPPCAQDFLAEGERNRVARDSQKSA